MHFNERYEYIKELGSGGMGHVFLVYDKKLEKNWAVKRVKQKSDNELEALCRISHAAFPRIVDTCIQKEFTYLVMDYVEGINLSTYMEEKSLTIKQIIDIGLQTAEALSFLHMQIPPIYFLDCKPANLIINPEGRVKVVDFGSVYFEGERNILQHISGTGLYASNEQKCNSLNGKNISRQCDIYSIGMTMFYMITKSRHEFRDNRGRICVKHFNPLVPEGLSHIVDKCTRLNKEKRYQTMEEVISDLRNIKEINRKEKLKGKLKRLLFLLIRFVIILGIYLGVCSYKQNRMKENMYICFLLLILLLCSCRTKENNYWEVKKEVFKGCGRRFLYCILAVILLTVPFNTFAFEDHNVLKVIIKDNYNRNILVREGCAYSVSGNINLSIPADELGQGENILTVTCYDKEKGMLKSYSQTCKKERSSH